MKTVYDSSRLYKDNLRKKVTGVCAGVAKHFGLEPWMVRLGAVVAFLMFPMPLVIAYIAATLLLPSR